MTAGNDDATFSDALEGFHRGDFSRLEPLFDDRSDRSGKPQIIEWHEQGRLRDQPKALAEALTCASFLGRTSVAEYDPVSGALTNSGASDVIVAAPSIRGVPTDDLPWVLDEMFRAAGKFVYVSVPRGAETDDADWWRSQMEGAARRHPGPGWALRVGRREVGSR